MERPIENSSVIAGQCLDFAEKSYCPGHCVTVPVTYTYRIGDAGVEIDNCSIEPTNSVGNVRVSIEIMDMTTSHMSACELTPNKTKLKWTFGIAT